MNVPPSGSRMNAEPIVHISGGRNVDGNCSSAVPAVTKYTSSNLVAGDRVDRSTVRKLDDPRASLAHAVVDGLVRVAPDLEVSRAGQRRRTLGVRVGRRRASHQADEECHLLHSVNLTEIRGRP